MKNVTKSLPSLDDLKRELRDVENLQIEIQKFSEETSTAVTKSPAAMKVSVEEEETNSSFLLDTHLNDNHEDDSDETTVTVPVGDVFKGSKSSMRRNKVTGRKKYPILEPCSSCKRKCLII